MPTYEYKCQACEALWEEWQSINDTAKEFCPHCGAKSAQRLISRSNFKLAGNNWASDGYSPGNTREGSHNGNQD